MYDFLKINTVSYGNLYVFYANKPTARLILFKITRIASPTVLNKMAYKNLGVTSHFII
jgi:hypothetical protein